MKNKSSINITLLISILFVLSGCNGWSKYRYYESFNSDEISKSQFSVDDYYQKNINESKDKNYCVYSISYFLPLNFWNLRFNDTQYIRKAIRDLNKKGHKGKDMQYVKIKDTGFGSPLFSYFCIEVSGNLVDSNVKIKK